MTRVLDLTDVREFREDLRENFVAAPPLLAWDELDHCAAERFERAKGGKWRGRACAALKQAYTLVSY